MPFFFKLRWLLGFCTKKSIIQKIIVTKSKPWKISTGRHFYLKQYGHNKILLKRGGKGYIITNTFSCILLINNITLLQEIKLTFSFLLNGKFSMDTSNLFSLKFSRIWSAEAFFNKDGPIVLSIEYCSMDFEPHRYGLLICNNNISY